MPYLLLDRALISSNENLLTFKATQEIFGYVDKSSYIDLLELLFKGNEELTLNDIEKFIELELNQIIF